MSIANSPFASAAFADDSELNVTVGLTGITVSFTPGNATVEGDAVFLVSGVESSTALGQAVGEPESIYPLSGIGVDFTLESFSSVTGGADVLPTGEEITSSTGSLGHTASVIVSLTGNNIQFSEGTITRKAELSDIPGNTFAGAPFAAQEEESREAILTGLNVSSEAGSIATQTDNIIPVAGLGIDMELGTAQGIGLAVATPTGLEIESNEGNLTTQTDNIIPVTGFGLTSTINLVGIVAGGSVSVVAPPDIMDAFVGDATIAANSDILPTGVEAEVDTGTLGMAGDALVTPTGVASSFSDGTPTIITGTGIIVSVTGVSMQFSEGTETIAGSAVVTPTGIEISAFVGNMRSTPWANVVTNANNTWTPVAA